MKKLTKSGAEINLFDFLRGKECRYGKMHEMKVVAFFTPDTLVKTASSYVASLRSYCPSTVDLLPLILIRGEGSVP